MGLQVRHAINAHKLLTAPLVLLLMYAYGNGGVGAWLYLALHGTYAMLWLVKDQAFPDKNFNEREALGTLVINFVLIAVYWVAPLCVVRNAVQPPGWVVELAVCLALVGCFLMLGADAEKSGLAL